MTLARLSVPTLKNKLKKLDAVYHITEDVETRYRIIRAEDDIKDELRRRGEIESRPKQV